MNFSNQLIQELSSKHLLKHPFYQAWTCGELSLDTLRTYARQYYHHVSAFPRYLSATHSQCEDIRLRQILLENLLDEEKGEENHPELWLRFAESLGDSREKVQSESLSPQTRKLIETFFGASKASFAEGLGALFAYEHQVPEVAASKIEGLQKHYGIQDPRGLEFFQVHLKADVYHTQSLSEVMDRLPPQEQEKVRVSAHSAADALWHFLDGMEEVRKSQA